MDVGKGLLKGSLLKTQCSVAGGSQVLNHTSLLQAPGCSRSGKISGLSKPECLPQQNNTPHVLAVDMKLDNSRHSGMFWKATSLKCKCEF